MNLKIIRCNSKKTETKNWFRAHSQGGHGTGKTGKTGNLKVRRFPDRENTGNLPKKIKNVFYTGNLTSTQGKFGGEKKNVILSGLNYPLAVLCQDLGL